MYKELKTMLSKRSINIPAGNIYDQIEKWKSWYRGNVDDFHYYNVTLANGSVTECERLTMSMGKKIAEDFNKLIWSEKVQINLDDDDKTDMLWEILDSKENNFSIAFPDLLEKTFALGTGAMVEYLVDGEVKIDYIDADSILPFNYDNKNIKGFIALSQWTEGAGEDKKCYTLLTFHEYNNGFYTRKNELYKSSTETSLGKLVNFEDAFPNVPQEIVYETDEPHFQIITPNITNNFDLNSPMGISVFANSIDKLKSIDIKYDSFAKEYQLGKKRILVDKTAIKSSPRVNSETGAVTNVSYFDSTDQTYVAINGMENQPIKEIDMKLRHKEHIEGINADLSWLGAGVGLGQEFYSFDGKRLKTATEVISDKSDTYRTKVHHQIIIKEALYGLVKSIMFLIGMESEEINIVFDDSIIEDTNSEIERGMKLYGAGLISKEKFLTKYLGYTEAQVKEEFEKMKEENKIITPEAIDFM